MQRLVLLLILLAAAVLFLSEASFVAANQCPAPNLEWLERRTPEFALVYSRVDSRLQQPFSGQLAPQLQADYLRFSQLFDAALPLPITLRAYPDLQQYLCLNPVAAPPPPNVFHSHIGAREIVLISQFMDFERDGWQSDLINAVRYEMALLFVEQISDGQAPPGLMAGIAIYTQEPAIVMTDELVNQPNVSDPELSWRVLWESSDTLQERALALEAMTTVAYLVDVYGWPKFQQFLHALSTTEGYRQALWQTYEIELADLQAQWVRYYPVFFQGRWRANVFYGFDFAEFERLIELGAYADATQSLREAMVFLEGLGDTESIVYAQELLARSETGQEAGALLRQSRQALQNKQYEQAVALAEQSEEKYIALGDSRRIEELNSYRVWAEEILAMRAELNLLENEVIARDQEAAATRLLEMGPRLRELGDTDSVSRIEALLQQETSRQQQAAVEILQLGLLAIIALVVVRLLLLLWRVPPEARLT